MYRLMFIQFIRSKTCQLGIALALILGIISIMTGKQFLEDQKKATSQVVEKQEAHIQRNLDLHKDDLGLLLYYLKFAVVNQRDPLAALSIGQSDLNPGIQSVSILTLEGQKHDTDLVNPVKLLFGNLDLSFVFIYVFPLLIITFTYNLRSEEEESGTWKIVSTMSQSTTHFLLKKLLVRISIIILLLFLLYLAASIVLGISISINSTLFITIAILYQLFWFSLCFCIVTLRRNSNFNAVTLLSCWIVLTIILPSIVNNLVTVNYPVPEALTTMIKQRDGYHEKWDTDKRATLEKFYSSYPQLEKFGYPTDDGFNWHWYYAMQHLGDEESRVESASMENKMIERASVSSSWAQFIPSMHTQMSFNEIAGTNLQNHMSFLKEISRFHEETRLYFYPKLFSEAS
ncbi:ABC transporter permease, partial [Marivirga lumbricoides]